MFDADRHLYHSTLGLRVINKKARRRLSVSKRGEIACVNRGEVLCKNGVRGLASKKSVG